VNGKFLVFDRMRFDFIGEKDRFSLLGVEGLWCVPCGFQMTFVGRVGGYLILSKNESVDLTRIKYFLS